MTASWIITETATGRAVLETWQASVAAKVNRDRYTVTPALECAERALESAREFHKRMGFVPFWGKRVEIRRGKSIQGLTRAFGEDRNQAIVAGTKVYRVLSVEMQP